MLGQGKVVFEKELHDFGSILETDAQAEYSFRFINEGDTTVQITNVSASCGCTSPSWSSELISPGDTGQVLIRYSTINRPGPFNKSIQVSSTGSIESHMLYVSGRVIPKSKSIESELRVRYGAIGLKHRSLNMGKITTEGEMIRIFQFFNASDTLLRVDTTSIRSPHHIALKFSPPELEAGAVGSLVLTYDPGQKGKLGYQTDKISFVTNEANDSLKSLYVVATIEEYFPEMSEEELEQAPRLELKDKSINLSKVVQGDTLSTEIVLKNSGKQVLEIRDIQANCECVITQLDQNSIDPGEEVKLMIEFDTSGRRGRQYKSLTIFSNDPKASAQTVTIRADVEVTN